MSCKNCKKNRHRILKEQYNEKGTSLGGTNTSSSGEYTSAGAWDQKGPFFKTKRGKPKTEVKEVDITGGAGQEYKGYNKGLSIDQVPTDNQSPGDNIESTDDIGPRYSITTTQDNGYRDPYDNDNPDPYDRQYPDPKTKPKKEWRSPPCCRPCGGGKWKRDCGKLERAPGSKKSNSTGCVYKSYSDCQLAGKSLSEQTSADNSGQYDTPKAWEAGGILTTKTGVTKAGTETLAGAPEVGMADDFSDVDVTIFSMEDMDETPTNLENLLGDILSNDNPTSYTPEETSLTLSLDTEIPDEEEEDIDALYEKKAFVKSTLNESVKNIRKMIKRIS